MCPWICDHLEGKDDACLFPTMWHHAWLVLVLLNHKWWLIKWWNESTGMWCALLGVKGRLRYHRHTCCIEISDLDFLCFTSLFGRNGVLTIKMVSIMTRWKWDILINLNEAKWALPLSVLLTTQSLKSVQTNIPGILFILYRASQYDASVLLTLVQPWHILLIATFHSLPAAPSWRLACPGVMSIHPKGCMARVANLID